MTNRLISVSRGTCAACGDTSEIRVVETRRHRSLASLLDRQFDPAILRLAECAGCGNVYAIRSTDNGPYGASRRQPAGPSHRRRASAGREWNYPAVA